MEILPKTVEEREKDILWIFDFALLLKAVNGGLEMLGAMLVLLVPPALVLQITEYLTGGEISQDADDPIINAIRDAAQAFTVHTHYFLAFYLFLHGIVKVILVVGIFKGKEIAYRLLILALLVFGTYEVYRGFMRHEFLVLSLGVFDYVLILLTAHEYRRRYSENPFVLDRRADYGDR